MYPLQAGGQPRTSHSPKSPSKPHPPMPHPPMPGGFGATPTPLQMQQAGLGGYPGMPGPGLSPFPGYDPMVMQNQHQQQQPPRTLRNITNAGLQHPSPGPRPNTNKVNYP